MNWYIPNNLDIMNDNKNSEVVFWVLKINFIEKGKQQQPLHTNTLTHTQTQRHDNWVIKCKNKLIKIKDNYSWWSKM